MSAAAASQSSGGLRRCVGDVEAFLEKVWTRGPHLHERAGDDTFADLLSLDHVDRILSTMSLRTPAFRLVKDGKPLPSASYTRSGRMGSRTLNDLADTGRIYEHFAGGATIVLQGLQRWWGPLSGFCRQLESELTHPIQANAYVTPPGSQGLRVHHDTHDVFAMQTYGRKRWVTYQPVITDPLSSQRWSGHLKDHGDPTLDIELGSGDCLYVPRGTLHAAATVDVASIHVTIGIRSVTWYEVFRRLLDEAADEQAFRQALPAGFARDGEGFAEKAAERLGQFAAWITDRDARAVAATEQRHFWAGRQPDWDGQLRELVTLADINDDTVVERRPHAVGDVVRRDGGVVLVLGDRRVRMPAHAEPAMRFVLERSRLRVGELAAHLDEEGRRVLVRRLVREGLLRRA